MLRWIRGVRFNLKTSLVLLAVALLWWALVVYMNIQDFVPEEFKEPETEQPTGQRAPGS